MPAASSRKATVGVVAEVRSCFYMILLLSRWTPERTQASQKSPCNTKSSKPKKIAWARESGKGAPQQICTWVYEVSSGEDHRSQHAHPRSATKVVPAEQQQSLLGAPASWPPTCKAQENEQKDTEILPSRRTPANEAVYFGHLDF